MPPADLPFDKKKRREIGGVLDEGEAGARRNNPLDGVGESNLRAHRAAVAGIWEWIPDNDAEPGSDLFDQRPDSGKPVEIPAKTVPSSSSISTEATESTAPENTAAE